MTDDSNEEFTFEFIERKTDDRSATREIMKTGSFSSLSSSISVIMPSGVSTSSEKLISNIAPPTALPSFVSNPETPLSKKSSDNLKPSVQKNDEPIKSMLNTVVQSTPLQQKSPKVTAAVTTTPPIKKVQSTLQTDSSIEESGLFGGRFMLWLKEVIVEKTFINKYTMETKNNFNTMMTTLDPQMREFIYSGGDVKIVVASDKDVKISLVRQAFQTVFGKATVTGVPVDCSVIAAQPVGFAAGIKGAKDRINSARNDPTLPRDIPIIAIENFLLEVGEDKWYDLGVILLNDPKNDVNLQTFTQMTPVPSQIVTMAQKATPENYPLKWSGLTVTVGSLMASNLQVSHNEWHQALTGVSRRDITLLAVQSLAGIYKNTINPV